MSTSNTTQSTSAADGRSLAPLLLTAAITTMLAWVLLLRPAQQQLAQLSRQCEKLEGVVQELSDESTAVERSSQLLVRIKGLSANVAAAESSLNRFNKLHADLTQHVARLESTTGAIDTLAGVEESINNHRRSLDSLLNSLYGLSASHYDLLGASDVAKDSHDALDLLDDLHLQLIAHSDDARRAQVTLEQLTQLSESLVAGKQQALAAAAVAETWAVTQNALARQLPNVEQSQQAAQVLVAVGKSLSEQGAQLVRSQRNLDRMITINKQLANQADTLAAAGRAIAKIDGLRSAVTTATETIDSIQHMVVDICLTDPAATQAISTLRPVVEQSPPTADEGDLVESPSIAPRPSIYQALGVAAGLLAR